ncbi:DUF128 domain-containing protein [Methanosphaera sp. WGK6]|uniref:DUF128 domain-containing protein n=1 Tax=Methanosphaera sp. WGK6 TaxID=1561964 RepID=UPI00084BE490|nr:DUF128 domain-containing protein [Methanosphaera sp. WGK6]OED30288.1 membrane protein [Methanosphaera sp. WGK6]
MKMMEILRILYEKNEILGAKVISEELEKRGYSLGERAVRYHMHILDERGLTEKIGYKGRQITKKGISELKKGLIYDQVDFTFSRVQEKMFNVTLNPLTLQGSVIVNISSINELDAIKTINNVFEAGLAVSSHYNIYERNDKTYFETVCGTTIDGLMQQKGIISKPLYGGLLKVEDYTPITFVEQIAYEKTSITPLEAFTNHNNTSVLDVANDGTGIIPANFRVVPEAKKDEVITLLDSLKKIGICGVIHMGKPGESVLGIPVPEGMIGIAIIGGVAPLCAAQEEGYDLDIKLADRYDEYNNMITPNYLMNLPLKKVTTQNKENKVSFILNKIFNLISKVDYDINNEKGNIIANISYVHKDDLDDSIEVMKELYKSKPEYCMGKRYSVVESSEDKVGLATICSLTMDGVLTKQGINSTPVYSGILDIYGSNRRFIELISYTGSSVDPHEIFIKKGMHDIHGSLNDDGKIMASVHSVHYVARDKTIDTLNSLKEVGLEVLNIGKPNEYTYNAKIEKYNFGYVLSGGLNPIVAIKEKNIPVEVKSIEKIMKFDAFEEL